MASTQPVSVLRTAHELQKLIQTGQISSEELVLSFLDQIDKHNDAGLKLKAILSVCPRDIAISHARRLDDERRQGKVRSDLHGIPIILKVDSAP
jgi:amidase